jgi:hypothetical protein
MANSFTGINDTIIVQDAFEAFKAGMAPLSGFSTSYDSEAARKGEKVSVPVIAGRTAASRGDGATYQVTTGNTVAVKDITLNQLYHAPWYITDVQDSKTAVRVWEASAKECAYALAKQIFDAVLLLFRGAHTTAFGDTANDVITVAPAAFDLDDLADLSALLTKKGAIGPRTLLVTTDYATALKKDNQVQDVSAYGSDDVIRTGEFRVPMYGIRAYEVPDFPALVSDTDKTGGILAVPSAVGIALRPVQPLDTGKLMDWQVVSDPETGLSMGYRRWYDESTGTMWGTFEALYGVAAIRTAAETTGAGGGAVRVKSE